jgi:phosphoribosylaminoimidazole-succinocarboxamide synthase
VTALDLPLLHSGKVREMYEVDDRHLLMVASDRISAFDVVFDETVPDKGRVLTAMTAFWAELLLPVAPTHLDGVDPAVHPDPRGSDPWLAGRALLVRRADMVPLECIVRGYLTGSAWAEYERSGTMHGEALPGGLAEAAALPEPVFTPSTKAPGGEHDVNIGFEEACDLVGAEVAAEARELSLAAYRTASAHAATRGVIIADTKFELGFVDGRLVIADELLTPDSSRFWPAESWRVGSSPPSLDKQPIRDWSAATGWDRRPPAPSLPDSVVAATRDRYVEAYERLTGRSFADALAATGAAA